MRPDHDRIGTAHGPWEGHSGLRNLPFRDFHPNAAWLELVLTGQDLARWTQRLLLADTPARRWEPK